MSPPLMAIYDEYKDSLMDNGFIKLNRSEITLEIMRNHPNCFMLLTQIAYRVRREATLELKVGQARIGDYKECGLTEQKYRTAKKWLEDNGLITTQATYLGTIATLCNSKVYDCNISQGNDPANMKLTGKQRTDNGQVTTNKKERSKKEEKEYSKEFEEFWKHYHENIKVDIRAKKDTYKYWNKLSDLERVNSYKNVIPYSKTKSIPDHCYLGYARSYLSDSKFIGPFKVFKSIPKNSAMDRAEARKREAQLEEENQWN